MSHSSLSSTKKCLICNLDFEFLSKKQKYCSKACNAKSYRLRRPYRVKESKTKYYKANIQEIRKANKDWYSKNKDHMSAYRKSRSEINKSYWKQRRQIDPIFKIKNNFRNRLRSIVKGRRSSLTLLLGCSEEELRIHLELQFQPGMSWENYGKNGWHVDHIIPCNSFDFTNQEDLKKCWHYTNLQPLWEADNLSKWCKHV